MAAQPARSFLRSSGFTGATETAELKLLYQGTSSAEEGPGGKRGVLEGAARAWGLERPHCSH